ncbi:MAG: hypothetical protein KAV69_06385 [Deltaproteobacteria bacterium]|nr:hypothetical protein [Deltaproteobacteria bacterium]
MEKSGRFWTKNSICQNGPLEGSTLVWGVKRAIEGVVPDIIHDAGDIGKEPIIRVLGHDPLEVVDKALRLAGFS